MGFGRRVSFNSKHCPLPSHPPQWGEEMGNEPLNETTPIAAEVKWESPATLHSPPRRIGLLAGLRVMMGSGYFSPPVPCLKR